MRLIDCFIESIAYTVETAQSGTSQPYRDVKSHIISSLDSLAGHAAEGGYSEQQYRLALFATVSFIDEKLVSSSWDGKKEWSRELLQKHYFDTSNGGVEFFERLDRLNPFNPAERDIREVYYYCMALGFAGKFYGEGAQSALERLKQTITICLTKMSPTRWHYFRAPLTKTRIKERLMLQGITTR